MKSSILILLCSSILCTGAKAPRSEQRPEEASAFFQARPFHLSEVRLLPSPFKDVMDRTCAYLKFLDADRMLYSFRQNYALPTKGAEPPGGWEEPDGKLRGHSMGHYLVALAQAYASSGERAYKVKAEYLIDELEKCQKRAVNRGYNAGYLSAYGEYQFEELEQLRKYPDIWAPFYTQHKIISGLLACYSHLESAKALKVATRMGDWVYNRLSRVDRDQLQKMWDIYIAGEYGGMNEVLAELYAITGERKYLAAARLFDHDRIFEPCADDRDELSGVHANQTIPKITGALRIYEQTNEGRYYDVATHFWKMVTEHHQYIIGGTGEGEMFRDADAIGGLLTDRTCETCCTYNMLKLTKGLFVHDPAAAYMDYYERGLYNHILASQDPRSGHGFTTYFVPLKPGGRKRYSSDYDSFSCCHGTGMENHTKYGESIYFYNDSTLWVNLFIPSELQWSEKNITLRQETRFPEEQRSTLTVKGSGTFTLKIRWPLWAQDGFSVEINSMAQAISAKPGSYMSIHRDWKDGDKIRIFAPFAFRLEYTTDRPDLGGIMYGPLLLAGENVTSLTTLRLNPSDPGSSFTADVNDPLHFTCNSIAFIPFYKVHGIPYSVYFKFDPSIGTEEHQRPRKSTRLHATMFKKRY